MGNLLDEDVQCETVTRAKNKAVLFDAFRRGRFGRHTCFLCGNPLSGSNRSDEHIFPRWVQDRFCLRDQRLTLLNSSTIPYRSLKIPCCKECNNEHLAGIEDTVRRAVDQGPHAVASLSPLTLFLWLGKIFYGLLYKEHLLVRERQSKRKARIVPRKFLEQYRMHHLFLQASRIPFDFHGSFPFSVFVFSTQTPSVTEHQWDFRDAFDTMTVSCRIGNVGILAALQDGGALRILCSEDLAPYQAIELHPLQFLELTAQFFCKARLLDRTPGFMIASSEAPVHVVQTPLGGASAKPIFGEWNSVEYAHVLSQFLSPFFHVPVEHVLDPSGRMMTWLHDDAGNLRQLDLGVQPWPPVAICQPEPQ